MSQLSAKLRMTDRGPAIWCLGCNQPHIFNAKETPTNSGDSWTWDRDIDRPTFSPSMHIRVGTGVRVGGDPRLRTDWIYRTACHSWVVFGKIQFLPDSAHKLSGQTMDVPDWPAAIVASYNLRDATGRDRSSRSE